ncbi:putative Ig domain-containing protein [Consotaella salsifontis]|uniref:putative Ig domain-containing protein n=1 Tax=Consotaella salsifontis TaxID=1365950 RepID=UPI001FDAB79E|nr:putative Ig domain-containing protein [Consotaella salsifontis]
MYSSTHTIAGEYFYRPINFVPSGGALADATLGVTYSQTITVSGGTFTGATGLPAGLSFDPSAGVISGTPTMTGDYSVRVSATNGNNTTGTANYTLKVKAPAVTFSPAAGALADATVGTAYSQTITAAHGTLTGASGLPAGLSFDPSTGIISGTPTTAGSASITVSADDAANTPATATYTLAVKAAPVVLSPTPGALPNAAVGVAYDQSITITNGTATRLDRYGTPGVWGLTPELSANVVRLHGTPLRSGTYPLDFKMKDGDNVETTVQYSVTIDAAPPVTFSPTAGLLPEATVGTAYSQTISVTHGTLTGATGLPAGLSFDPSTGIISGTPTTVSNATITVSAKDLANVAKTANYTLVVQNAVPTITSVNPSSGPVEGGNLAVVQGSNLQGVTEVHFYLKQAEIISRDANSITVKVPPADPNWPTSKLWVQLYSPGGSPVLDQAYQYTVPAPVFSPAAGALPAATAGTAYSQTISVTDGTLSGATGLPAGLSFNAGTGLISGTPINAGSATITVSALDRANVAQTAQYTLTVNAAGVIFSPAPGSLPGATAGVAYSQTITVTNGSILGAKGLPLGLTMDTTTGLVSGTPAIAGDYSIVVGVKDGAGQTVTAAYTLKVKAVDAVVFAPAAGPLPNATAGVAYSQTITVTNGTIAGATGLPAGLTFDVGTGIISGTPTVAGTATITVSANDGANATQTAAYTLKVQAVDAVVFAPVAGPLPSATAGIAYSQTITVTNGTIAGATGLPAGLSFDVGTGTISGTPTAAGTATITVSANDGANATQTAAYTLTVEAAAVAFAPAAGALPDATAGTPYSQTITVTNGTLAGATGLPAGLAFDAGTGILSGTPTTAGTATITVSATDGANATQTAAYTIKIKAADVVFAFTPKAGALAEAMAGEAYSQTISVSGGTGTTVYRLASGALPDGLVLNVSTGTLTGPLKAGTAGSYSFTLEVTDGNGAIGSASYTLKVVPQQVAAADKVVELAPGEAPANVYLNQGATGGPFNDAAVSYVQPASAGTAQIIEGEVAALDAVRPRGYYLKFTPNPQYTGTAVVGYTLTSALGTSNTGTVTYVVPLDQTAVAEAADRAVRNFVSARQSLLANHVATPGLVERRMMSSGQTPGTLEMTPNGNGVGVNFSSSTAQIEAARLAATGAPVDASALPRFNAWVSGTFLLHKEDGDDNQNDDWDNFGLVSMGADYLVTDKFLFGIALHADHTTDTTNDADVDGDGFLIGPYASYELAPSLYLDGSLYYGQSWNTVDLESFKGDFDTTRFMATAKLEGVLGYRALMIRPNLKVSYLNESVDDYSVKSGASSVDVSGFTEDDLRFSAGAKFSYAVPLDNGWTMTPTFGASVGLASNDGNSFDNIGDGIFGSLEAGFVLAGDENWSFQANSTLDLDDEGVNAVGGRIGLSIPF